MKINGIGNVHNNMRAQRKKKDSVQGFDGFLEPLNSTNPAESTSSADEVRAIAPLTNVIPLQIEEQPQHEQDAEYISQSEAGIEILNQLQKQLLNGDADGGALHEMRSQLRKMEALQPRDAGLNGLIEDIKLRLAVEIAKREKAE